MASAESSLEHTLQVRVILNCVYNLDVVKYINCIAVGLKTYVHIIYVSFG